MPTVSYIAKAASPEDISWRQRIARNEKGLLRLFLRWVDELRDAISDAQLAQAVIAGAGRSFDHVLQAISFQPVEALEPVAVDEAVREFDRLVHDLGAALETSLNSRDPNFQLALEEQGARLVREVSDETRRAIRNMVSRAYQMGEHPYSLVSELRQLVGLTSRQAQAVLNFRAAQVRSGARPEVVTKRTARYADQMLTRRARTIARTETARAMILAKQESWRQAVAAGLLDPAETVLVWSSVQTDPTEICYQLNGQEVPLGETFPEGMPPIHPNCRCNIHPEVRHAGTDDMLARLLSRVPQVNARHGIPQR